MVSIRKMETSPLEARTHPTFRDSKLLELTHIQAAYRISARVAWAVGIERIHYLDFWQCFCGGAFIWFERYRSTAVLVERSVCSRYVHSGRVQRIEQSSVGIVSTFAGDMTVFISLRDFAE